MKQIKNITLAATLLLLAAGCTADADAEGEGTIIPPGTPIEVDFTLPGVSQIMPGSTRAITTTPLERGRTVRIIPYNERTKQEEAQATYYVTDDAGTLAPCTVNADGSFAAADTQKMKLKLGDKYTLNVISSALPYPSGKVNNGTDFAYVKRGKTVSSKDITLGPLLHSNAQLKIVVKKAAADTYISGITAHGDANNPPIKLSGLRDASIFLGHQDMGLLRPADTYNASLSVLPASITQTDATTLTTTPQYVLNGITTLDIACMLNLSLKYSSVADAVTKQVTYVQKVTFNTSLSPGYSYLLTLEVNSENATVIPSVQITDWDMTGGDLTPPTDSNRYPYVIANGEGKKRVIVTKDVFGESTLYQSHTPWLQTPAHNVEDKETNLTAAKFEIAESDVSEIPAPWGNTNGPCVAPWRRFTGAEYMMINFAYQKLEITPLKPVQYWMSEEVDKDSAYCVADYGYPLLKSTPAYTRCVRDYGVVSADYAHVVGSSIISKDEYGTTGGTFHPNWGSNDVPLHYRNDAQYNTVSARFEVGDSFLEHYTGEEAKTFCAAYSRAQGAAGTWRVPTMAELILMDALKAQLPDDGGWGEHHPYMSSTHKDTGENDYWVCVPKLEDSYVSLSTGYTRCVRDY